MTDISIHTVMTPAEISTVQDLCWQYRAHLMSHEGAHPILTETFYPVPLYTALLDRLETEHAAPDGVMLLALSDGQPVGCGMYRRFDADACEIKRVFVQSDARGVGVGRLILQSLLLRAAKAGYSSALLDTMPTLHAARRLYTASGFRERGAYAELPDIAVGKLCFYEYDLTA